MDYLGIDIRCATESLSNGEFPAKDCLLPLISKLLGYFLVAASMTVKLPQVLIQPIQFNQCNPQSDKLKFCKFRLGVVFGRL